MQKCIYSGSRMPLSLKELNTQSVLTSRHEGDYPTNDESAQAYHLEDYGVTLKVSYVGSDPVNMSVVAYGSEKSIGEVERIILEELTKPSLATAAK